MTDTRTTNNTNSLGLSRVGELLVGETFEGDFFDSSLETFETVTKDDGETNPQSTDDTTVLELVISTDKEKFVAEEGDMTFLTSMQEFDFSRDDMPSGAGLATEFPEDFDGDYTDNTIDGNDFDNTISGYGGDDTLYGAGGEDNLYGGEGSDILYGGSDGDYLSGGSGTYDDELYGGAGDDFLTGGPGMDTLYGGDGSDGFSGGHDEDELFGGNGNDTLVGGAGNDTVYGGDGDDVINDRSGSIHHYSGDDIYFGGAGADTFIFSRDPSEGLDIEAAGGLDVIEDFELGVDTLQISQDDPAFAGLTFNEYIDQYTSGGGELGVVLEWEGGAIRLTGIEAADLTPFEVTFSFI